MMINHEILGKPFCEQNQKSFDFKTSMFRLTPRMGPYTRVVTEPLEIPSGFPGDAENATS